jgi:flagellar hook-length control protein FliK
VAGGQAVTAQSAQPIAAALVINSQADPAASADARGAIDPQGTSRGRTAVIAGGAASSPVQTDKTATAPGGTTSNSNTAQADSATTGDSSASANQPASQPTSVTSGANPANAPSASNAAQQPQGQPQPAATPAAAFTIAAAGAQTGGVHAGQGSDGIGAAPGSGTGGQSIGAATNAGATSNVLASIGVQTASAASPSANVSASSAAAVPIAGLAVEIASRARAGSHQFDIRLDPPELGRIDVRLDVDRNGQVTSHVTVDRPDTLQLLQNQQPQLQRALEQAGLTTTNNGLQFTLRDQSFAGQNGSGNGGQQPGSQLVIPDPKLSAIDTTQVYSRWNLGSGLDIRV